MAGATAPPAYLYYRKVPGQNSPRCGCGSGHQTPRHITIFCREIKKKRLNLYAQTHIHADFNKLCKTPEAIPTLCRWFLDLRLLPQYYLASDFIYEWEDTKEYHPPPSPSLQPA